MGNKKMKAYLGLTFVTLIWGASFVSIKICMTVFGPAYLAFFRYLLTSILIFITLKISRKLEKVQNNDYFRLFISGILGVTIYFWCENSAVLRISSNEASILIGTIPLFSLIFNRIIYKSKITKRNLFSIIFSIIGIYLIIGGAAFSLNILGYVLMFMAAISWSIYQFVTKPLFGKYSDMTITMYQSFFGFLGFLPILRYDYIEIANMNINVMIHFLFLTLFCSAIATYIYLFSQKTLGINITSVFLNLIPVFTFVFSFLFLGEVLSIIQLIGAIIVIVSVSCVKEEVVVSENLKTAV
ncbi:MAG: DMT family transporter [Proteocatella sp.]